MKKKSFLKKFILIFTFLGLIGGGTFYFVDSQMNESFPWHSYSPGDQRFHIQFPAAPEESSREFNIANSRLHYREFVSEIKDSLYAVSYLDFPGKWKLLGTKKILSKSFDFLLEKEKDVEQLLKKEFSTYRGFPALDYSWTQAGKEVQGKLVVAGNRLYRVMVSYPHSLEEKVQPEAFFDSFQVTK